jgi:hypothetical protein
VTIPADAKTFIDGVLKGIGAPINAQTEQGFVNWLANEQGGPNLTAFEANKGNPLGVGNPAGHAAGASGNLQDGIKVTVANLLGGSYNNLVAAFRKGTSSGEINQQVVASIWNTGKPNGYGGIDKFSATANGASYVGNGSVASSQGEVGSVNIPKSAPAAPIAGANIKNFHGYDLTAFAGSPDLGNAEQVVTNYVSNPQYRQQLDQKLATEYGYQTNWWKNIPQVNTVMLYAAQHLDPTAAGATNTFQSLLANTQWWKTTTSNGRYWDEAYGTNGAPGTDPAQANQAIQNAQEKVLADANQIGVQLSKQELDAIALAYAKNNYVASGSFGTASGTAPEWLDQAIVDTLENIQGQKIGKIPTDFSTLAPGTNQFGLDTQGAPGSTPGTGTPTGLTGISGQLYADFQNIAQQYLMYSPTNASGSLVNNQYLLNQVQSALAHYTGTGSSFGSSNLIAGAQAQFTQNMMTMAKQMYPSMAEAIAGGTTPQAYVQPYQSVIAQMTGIAPGSINFTDPKWNWVIATPDPKTGVKSALSLDQVQQKLATTPMFNQSNNAQQMADSVSTGLAKQWGFGGL